MPIHGLTDTARAFMRLGLIKKGEKQVKTFRKKDGTTYEKEVPVDLDYFRVVFSPGKNAGEIERTFRLAYGDRPQEINVRFADASIHEVWDANFECYKQGGLVAKAGTNESGAFWIFYRDPDTMEVLVRDGSPLGVAGREFIEKPIDLSTPVYHMANGEPAMLEPVGRLQVVIPEVAHIQVGYFEFQPLSPRDIRSISAELGMYAAMASSYGNTISGIPFVLGRREEQITKNINGKLSKGSSWPVHLTAGGVWGRQAIEMIERLALPEYVEAEVKEVTQNAPDWTEAPEEWNEPPAPEEPPAPVVIEAPKVEQPAVEMTDPLDKLAVGYASQKWNVPAAQARKDIEKAIGAGKLQSPMPKADFKKWVMPQGEPA
jgi:hypothetical protein